jgi:hypothetical protein
MMSPLYLTVFILHALLMLLPFAQLEIFNKVVIIFCACVIAHSAWTSLHMPNHIIDLFQETKTLDERRSSWFCLSFTRLLPFSLQQSLYYNSPWGQ